jgi:hypothetical protein
MEGHASSWPHRTDNLGWLIWRVQRRFGGVAKRELTDSGAWINFISHGILFAIILYTEIWIAPLFLRVLEQMLEGRPFPAAVYRAENVSIFFQHDAIFIVPIAVMMLWLDTMIFKWLLRQMGRGFAIGWSLCVALLLAGTAIFLLYDLTTPTTMMYRVLQHTSGHLTSY